MSRNPYVRTLLAGLYIVGIVFIINLISSMHALQQTLFLPILLLGFFVLSAVVMGYLFLAVPIELYLDEKRPEALVFFGRTVGSFALLVGLYLSYLLISFS